MSRPPFQPGGAAKVWIRRGRRKRRAAVFPLSGLGAEVHRRGISTAHDDRDALAGPRPIASGEDGGEPRGAARLGGDAERAPERALGVGDAFVGAEILALLLHDGGAPDVRPDGLLGRCDGVGIDHHWRSLKVPDGSSKESALWMLARAASHWSHPLPREQRKTRGFKTRCSTATFTRSRASLRRASAFPTFPSRWSPRARSHSSASWKPAQQ